jgi:hypothetical protein
MDRFRQFDNSLGVGGGRVAQAQVGIRSKLEGSMYGGVSPAAAVACGQAGHGDWLN